VADQTSSSLQIGAPPQDVLQVIADVHAYPEWNGEIKSVEVLDTEPDGRPRQVRFSISSSGMNDEYVLDYLWAADGVSWTLVEPSTLQKSQIGSYRLVPAGGGTDVRYDLKIDSRIPMIGPMRRKIEKRIVDGALKELKKRVESLG
jgi:uncharacterized membrane protein